MSTTVTVLGGVGLFLLGMSVMTGGLKALAGAKLRATLSRAAATPLSGTFWGAVCFFAGAALLLRADTTPTSEAIYVSSAASMS